MSTKVLLIGINYIGKPYQLQGPIYDVLQVRGLLIDAYDIRPSNIVTLRDDDKQNIPTKARILEELQKLVNSDAASILIMYSGHGTSIADKTGDETDSNDECIVPADADAMGIITDDQINAIVKNAKCTGLVLFDSCRSGTILDLQYQGYNSDKKDITTGGIYCISGCRDIEDSVEILSKDQLLPQGALTSAFISSIRELKYYPTIVSLWNKIKVNISTSGYTQVPQLTSNIEVTELTPFPFSKPLRDTSAEVNMLNTQVATLKSQNNALNQTVTTYSTQIASYKTTTDSLKLENTSLQQQITILQKQIVSLNNTQQYTAQITALNTQIAQITKKLNDSIKLGTTYLNENRALKSQNLIQQQDINKLRQQLSAKK